MTESGGGAGSGSAPQDQPAAMPPAPPPMPGAPAYVPPPVGMPPGGSVPPAAAGNPADVPSSAWITTAPQTAPKRSTGGRIGAIIGAIVLVVIVGAVIASVLGILPNDKGKVLFGTAAGSDLCSVGNQATSIKSTDPVFFAAILKDHMDGNQAIDFTVTKDGQQIVDHPEPADGTSFDCYGNKDSLGSLDPGTYVFQVTHEGTLEATGTLTVTQ